MYLPALADHPHGHVVAVCGRNPDTARALAEQWGVPQVFTDWTEMVRPDVIDAVVVASANDTHVPVTRAALEAGIHVLCEKPIALAAADAADLAAAAAARSGLTTMVGVGERSRTRSWKPGVWSTP